MTTPKLNKILHVEDEPDIQIIAQIALENIGGFTVKTCSTGNEALQVVQEFKPDLILIDVMMPDMDGPTTLKSLREIPEFADTPIIFMTARAQLHEISNYKKEGILEVITKPFDPMTLSSTIISVWEKYHEDRFR